MLQRSTSGAKRDCASEQEERVRLVPRKKAVEKQGNLGPKAARFVASEPRLDLEEASSSTEPRTGQTCFARPTNTITRRAVDEGRRTQREEQPIRAARLEEGGRRLSPWLSPNSPPSSRIAFSSNHALSRAAEREVGIG